MKTVDGVNKLKQVEGANKLRVQVLRSWGEFKDYAPGQIIEQPTEAELGAARNPMLGIVLEDEE